MSFTYAKFLHVVPFLVVSILLSSCGGGGGGGSSDAGDAVSPGPSPAVGASNSFAYVMNSASVSAFKIDGNTGNLTFAGTLQSAAPNSRMAVHPGGKFAYVLRSSSSGSGDVTAYRIQADGTLTPVDTAVAVKGITCITIHPSGKFLYVVYSTSPSVPPEFAEHVVITYAINATTGSLTLSGESPIAPPNTWAWGLFSLVIDPSGRFAYLEIPGIKSGSNEIQSFTINSANGALTPIATPNQWSNQYLSAMTTHPSGKFAYIAFIFDPLFYTNIPPNTYAIQAYNIADTGVLTEVGVPLTGNFRFIAVEPSGRFLYAVAFNESTGNNEVSGYIINPATGMLTSIGPTVAAGPVADASISVDPSGKFVYVLNETSESVYGYTINPVTGSLTPLGAPVPTGSGPTFITTTRTN